MIESTDEGERRRVRVVLLHPTGLVVALAAGVFVVALGGGPISERLIGAVAVTAASGAALHLAYWLAIALFGVPTVRREARAEGRALTWRPGLWPRR